MLAHLTRILKKIGKCLLKKKNWEMGDKIEEESSKNFLFDKSFSQ